MNVVLLSGGSGKRLWPLSNEIRSKQFIKFFKDDSGSFESMVQRVYRQIKKADSNADIIIATSKSQVSSINNQLGDNVSVSIEPYRKDTFPAIALAAMYLKDVKKVSLNEVVVVCPIDPYVDDNYFNTIKELHNRIIKCDSTNIVLMGIIPTYPSEKYGYIIPKTIDHISKVLSFEEKPNKLKAEKYISEGGLWNAGVFAFKLKYIVEIAHRLIDFSDYYDLYNKYHSLNKISFDYAVLEKEPNIEVVRFNGKWKDIGTWNTLTESVDYNIIGNGLINETSKNVSIINELNVPVLAMGLKNVVIAASPEGILVSDKDQSSYIKPYVDQFDQTVMYSEKSWGSYKVINIENGSLTILVTLNPGHSMNYHAHDRRDEIWVVIEGDGTTLVDGNKKNVTVGDVVVMKSGSCHMITAHSLLKLVEIQLGNDISVSDKRKINL